MDTATLTRPRRGTGPSTAELDSQPREPRPASRLRRGDLHRPALALLLIVSFVLRLWGIKQGLPYIYNVDEATHFVPKALSFFSHDLNPHYFPNPPGYTYLLYIVFELWFGSSDAVMRAYAHDPTTVYVVARVVAAVLGTAAVWLTYLAGARFFNRTVGLLAAAMLSLAFLPVFYSHLALNDVPTLAPVALSLYGIAGVMRRHRRRDYVVAGIGIGLAAATKYTGGITMMCLLVAAFCNLTAEPFGIVARRLALSLALALAAFVIANPYSVLDFSAFASGVSSQASIAAGQDPVKLGATPGSGITYYLWTFTWGLGWGPTLAAVGGAILLAVRKRLGMLLILVPAPIAFIIFMGDQQRFFGRWLLPIFPLIVILAAYGAVEFSRWIARVSRLPRPVCGTLTAILMLTQSVVAVIHNDLVLSRPSTANVTRAWMVDHIPVGSKVVIEPFVPNNWAADIGRSLSATPTGERWVTYNTSLTNLDENGNPLPPGQHRYVLVDQYERTLRPALLDGYIQHGYCWLVIGSLQAGRAFAQPQAAPEAVRYYAALARRAKLMYHISPFANGTHPVPFSFDWSIDYYPRQYHYPGPEMSVYHLTGGHCSP
jgi:4-amino-4-deoxy-L-arabinose transferase-like glycosyltransferase